MKKKNNIANNLGKLPKSEMLLFKSPLKWIFGNNFSNYWIFWNLIFFKFYHFRFPADFLLRSCEMEQGTVIWIALQQVPGISSTRAPDEVQSTCSLQGSASLERIPEKMNFSRFPIFYNFFRFKKFFSEFWEIFGLSRRRMMETGQTAARATSGTWLVEKCTAGSTWVARVEIRSEKAVELHRGHFRWLDPRGVLLPPVQS